MNRAQYAAAIGVRFWLPRVRARRTNRELTTVVWCAPVHRRTRSWRDVERALAFVEGVTIESSMDEPGHGLCIGGHGEHAFPDPSSWTAADKRRFWQACLPS